MKIRVLSDLHMEFTNYLPAHLDPVGEDLVVLAGDIGVGIDGIEWAKAAFAGRRVIYVLGNHEYYRHDWNELLVRARKAAQGSNVTFLENDVLDIDGVRILGCTLWTDFKARGAERYEKSAELARRSMNDYLAITNLAQKRRVILPIDVAERCEDSYWWLQQKIQRSEQPLLVITHHAPTMHGINPRFAHDPLNPAFHNAFDELVVPPVVAWIYGHNHYNVDHVVNGVRLISNQRGYPNEKLHLDWDACWSIDPAACTVIRHRDRQ